MDLLLNISQAAVTKAVMDTKKTFTLNGFTSLVEGLKSLGPDYGQITLHTNAALTLYLCIPETEREAWVSVVERAQRMRDGRTMLERVTELVSTPAPTSTAMGRIHQNVQAVTATGKHEPRDAKAPQIEPRPVKTKPRRRTAGDSAGA